MNEIFTFLQRLPKSALILALAVIVMLGPASSTIRAEFPAADKLTGTWEGTLTIAKGPQLKLVFEFFINADGDYRGFLTVPLQSEFPMFIEKVTIEGATVSVTIDNIGISYSGTLEDNSIEGKFKQGGGEFPLVLNRAQ